MFCLQCIMCFLFWCKWLKCCTAWVPPKCVIKCAFLCESHMGRWPLELKKMWESEERVIYWRRMEADSVGERMRSADRLSGKSSECWPFPTSASNRKPIAFKPKTTHIIVRHENYVHILSTAFSGVVCIHRQKKKHSLCFKSGDLIKPQVFLIFGAVGGVGCDVVQVWTGLLKRLHLCMSAWVILLCQVELIRVQLNLIYFLSL